MTQPTWISSPVEDSTDMGRRRSQRRGYLFEKSGAWILRWREDSKDVMGRATRDQRSMKIGQSKGPEAISKRQAQKLAWDLVLSKLETVSHTPGALITFGDFVRQRFEPDHLWSLKPAGQEHYRYMLSNHVLPFLGKYRLRDIDHSVVLDFLRTKREHYSSQTLTHFRNVISAVMRHARTLKMYAGELPTDGLKLPEVQHKERSALTAEQAARVIAALPGQYSTLTALLCTTGLRIGEAAGLKWKRIDFAAGTLSVVETFSKGKWVSPKSENSIRVVPVPGRILESIAAMRSRDTHSGPDDPVFITTHGNPIGSHTTAAKILKPVVRKLGMPWVCWHSFRHTNATLTDKAGMSPTGRQKLLGHGSAKVTARYTHPEVEAGRGIIEGIAAAVLPKDTPILHSQSAAEGQNKGEFIN